MLSLADLGIGNAMVYSMYKPLANENFSEVRTLINLMKKIYFFIGLGMAGMGIFVMPFIQTFIHGKQPDVNIYIVYSLFLLNTVSSYFFAYNRSLLIADQKNYQVVINDFVFATINSIVQIIILLVFKNFYFYLISTIFFTIIGNIFLSQKVSRNYSFLKEYKSVEITQKLKVQIKELTIGNLLGKIGTMFVTGTDNIFISGFVSLAAVGTYSNYLLVIASIQQVTLQLMYSVTGSIGNLIATESKGKAYKTFIRHNFINFTVLYFCASLMATLLNPFIFLWVGKEYIFSGVTVALIILNFLLRGYRLSSWVFIDALGLSWILRKKPLWESFINVIVSLFFLIVFKLGINGVLLGTSISSILVVNWWEPYAVIKHGMNKDFKDYLLITGKLFSVLALNFFILNIIKEILGGYTVIGFILLLGITLIISFACYYVFFNRCEEYNYVNILFKRGIGLIIRKKNR
ncbi:hypothetical protein D358_00008 [Enterococcus faecalis RP2S-4]|uniref:Transporter n=2 Tax=Enterococcus faecalis TaxID=1351 RepID=A0ABC9TNV1_ENTFL|nr:hypothetical protein D358_00008 [Enterococcus faecalis RP2S-4]